VTGGAGGGAATGGATGGAGGGATTARVCVVGGGAGGVVVVVVGTATVVVITAGGGVVVLVTVIDGPWSAADVVVGLGWCDVVSAPTITTGTATIHTHGCRHHFLLLFVAMPVCRQLAPWHCSLRQGVPNLSKVDALSPPAQPHRLVVSRATETNLEGLLPGDGAGVGCVSPPHATSGRFQAMTVGR